MTNFMYRGIELDAEDYGLPDSVVDTLEHMHVPIPQPIGTAEDVLTASGVDDYGLNTASTDKAMRFNEGKPRFGLMPPDGLLELAKVYTMGAKKYAARNWEKGLSWTECYDSLLRHANAWAGGETHDAESGLHHMAHVAWNAITLLTYGLRGVGTDDRK